MFQVYCGRKFGQNRKTLDKYWIYKKSTLQRIRCYLQIFYRLNFEMIHVQICFEGSFSGFYYINLAETT